tara:strand:- start:214 stop:834 length:621 start_codon:yes stop_codon:yes gene_type:complete
MRKIISFEGIDGCGKTTQINLLLKYFVDNNIDSDILREPGGTIISENIREILLDSKNQISPETETLLFLSARSIITNDIILPALEKNKVVLCDRFIDSTLAYQGYGRKIDCDLIKKINLFATQMIMPDLTLVFDIEPDLAFKRIERKNMDRMELSGREFLNNVRIGYLKIVEENPERCKLINCSNKDIATIHQEVRKIVKDSIKGD